MKSGKKKKKMGKYSCSKMIHARKCSFGSRRVDVQAVKNNRKLNLTWYFSPPFLSNRLVLVFLSLSLLIKRETRRWVLFWRQELLTSLYSDCECSSFLKKMNINKSLLYLQFSESYEGWQKTLRDKRLNRNESRQTKSFTCTSIKQLRDLAWIMHQQCPWSWSSTL